MGSLPRATGANFKEGPIRNKYIRKEDRKALAQKQAQEAAEKELQELNQAAAARDPRRQKSNNMPSDPRLQKIQKSNSPSPEYRPNLNGVIINYSGNQLNSGPPD